MGDLNEESLVDLLTQVRAERSMRPSYYVQLERHRFPPPEPTAQDVAYAPLRWTHESSFWDNGERFDVWVNWDDRVRIECNGEVVLKFWAPAGSIFRGMEMRRKARG